MLVEMVQFDIITFCENDSEIINSYIFHFEQTVSELLKSVSSKDFVVVNVQMRPIADKINKSKSKMIGIVWTCICSSDTLDILLEKWNTIETMRDTTTYYLDIQR